MDIQIPSVGESISEVRVVKWLKRPGDSVAQDEDIVELETDKASLNLPAPAAGVLGEILKKEGEKARIGETIARLDEKGSPGEAPERGDESEPVAQAEARAQGPTPVQEKATEPRRVNGKAKTQVQERPQARKASDGERAVPLSPLRKQIARRLVEAQRQAALLTTFNEIDLSAVNAARARYRRYFEDRHGAGLGLMPFFIKAVVDALKALPQLNAELRGEELVFKDRYDIGVAVASEKGLLVPVIRGADRLGFLEIEQTLERLAKAARENRISPEELSGGTFTITNGGVYGSLLSTPIVNPPQSGILGMHQIQERPVARDGEVLIRPMMYVALTYDHRVVDGKEAIGFLRRVKEIVEDPLRLLLEV